MHVDLALISETCLHVLWTCMQVIMYGICCGICDFLQIGTCTVLVRSACT